MAIGGLRDCPRCKQPVRDADWLQGICTKCSFDFGRMDPDYLADEIERQQEERPRAGLSLGIRALVVGAGVSFILAAWALSNVSSFALTARLPGDLKFAIAVVPAGAVGGVAALGAWGVAHAAQSSRRRSSREIWIAAIIGGISLPILTLLLPWAALKLTSRL